MNEDILNHKILTLSNEIQFLNGRLRHYIEVNQLLVNLASQFKSTMILYNDYPMMINELEKKVLESKEENIQLGNKIDTITKLHRDKVNDLNIQMEQQTSSSQETIEKLQSMIDSITNDSVFQTTDLHHQIYELKEQNEEISNFNKKFLEKESQYKELLEIKMNEIKSLTDSNRLKKDDLINADNRIRELEKELSEQVKYHSQLESCRKMLSSQKQNFEKQIDELKKTIDSLEQQIKNTATNHLSKRLPLHSTTSSSSTSKKY